MSNMLIKHYATDVIDKPDKIFGIYHGVVENRNDPENLGRCKVRVFGIHTEKNKEEELDGIPTGNLPWAEPVLSNFEGSISEMGLWTVPLQGAHVAVYFEAGDHMRPRYFGTLPGLPISQNPFDKVAASYSSPGILAPAPPPSGGQEGGMENPGTVPDSELGDIVVTISRTSSDERGVTGNITTNKGFKAQTLEMPWRNNQKERSCIPKGEYVLKVTPGPKWGGFYEVISPGNGRAGVRIHPKPYWAGDDTLGYKCELKGCICITSNLTLDIPGSPPRGPGKQWNAHGSKQVADFMNHTKGQPCKLIIQGVVG